MTGVVVTGSGHGIGRAVTARLAAEGAFGSGQRPQCRRGLSWSPNRSVAMPRLATPWARAGSPGSSSGRGHTSARRVRSALQRQPVPRAATPEAARRHAHRDGDTARWLAGMEQAAAGYLGGGCDAVKAWRVSELGEPRDVPRLVNAAEPEPGPGPPSSCACSTRPQPPRTSHEPVGVSTRSGRSRRSPPGWSCPPGTRRARSAWFLPRPAPTARRRRGG